MNRDLVDRLLRRLDVISGIDEDDVAAISELPINVRSLAAGQVIVSDGDRPKECCLMIEGFAVRSKTTVNGHRQILSIHIPGEIPDLQSLFLHQMDHDFVTVASCRLGFIAHESLHPLLRKRPNVAAVLWRDTLIDAAIFREWIVNIGARPAVNRLAHVAVELRKRLQLAGFPLSDTFDFPLTQEQVGEALGITPVHANRVINQLRDDNVIDISRPKARVLDEAKLAELAQFDDRYLHDSPSR